MLFTILDFTKSDIAVNADDPANVASRVAVIDLPARLTPWVITAAGRADVALIGEHLVALFHRKTILPQVVVASILPHLLGIAVLPRLSCGDAPLSVGCVVGAAPRAFCFEVRLASGLPFGGQPFLVAFMVTLLCFALAQLEPIRIKFTLPHFPRALCFALGRSICHVFSSCVLVIIDTVTKDESKMICA